MWGTRPILWTNMSLKDNLALNYVVPMGPQHTSEPVSFCVFFPFFLFFWERKLPHSSGPSIKFRLTFFIFTAMWITLHLLLNKWLI